MEGGPFPVGHALSNEPRREPEQMDVDQLAQPDIIFESGRV